MENKIKKKLIFLFKELNLYERIKRYDKNGFYINNMDIYTIIVVNFGQMLTEDEKRKILCNFKWEDINRKFSKVKYVLPPYEEDEYIKATEFFNTNGISWSSGHKFNEFNGWKGNAKCLEIRNGKITYSQYNKLWAKPINEFINDYNEIKNYINNNINIFIKQ